MHKFVIVLIIDEVICVVLPKLSKTTLTAPAMEWRSTCHIVEPRRSKPSRVDFFFGRVVHHRAQNPNGDNPVATDMTRSHPSHAAPLHAVPGSSRFATTTHPGLLMVCGRKATCAGCLVTKRLPRRTPSGESAGAHPIRPSGPTAASFTRSSLSLFIFI